MSITVETHEGIEPIAAEWDALVARTGASPFVRPGWFAAWQRAFGTRPLTVLCARRDRTVVGVLPVVRHRRAVRSPTNWHTPSFGPVCSDEGVAAELIRELLAMRPDLLDLSFLDSAEPGLEHCPRAARRLRYDTVCRVIERSPYIEIATDWESFEAGLSARRRSTMRRFRRRLEEQGSLSIDLERGDRGLEALLSESFTIESLGWKGKAGTAILSSPEVTSFYREIAAWAAARGWLRLWFLRLDGRAIAFAYCLEHGETHYELKVGFDPEYARFGPGVLLTRARLEHSFSEGLRSYEFLGQPERHKLDWTDSCRELARVQAFAPTLVGRTYRLAWTHGRSLALKARGLRRAEPGR